ncbi:phosphoribosylanthranilate isomerase [Deinococcus radiodurans]|uniref:N-(5'-phosphoribosyl)anthranilate isomerase n=1 Tax=Deinococcus radiodurans (strain ATCC 13939 / DSM 20539 / JCM 16871 / CCUG 27074 / LMG 4051 / NBRC 15346 / NCIMB 9279 / VKM B-1422 / R1) TaxID=243230 RepID=TRPF_DEIRA|nr:N-(5'-phosphoribosyl)anthranilate isomerase [Deinococcus radiodurans]Q9RY28.1 RecName: Full=N-(5'-phosphoribosyl)anthranilate isomerase; Short=PRAI [Deinococcus radiodurans R1 = ATCC 13939 = DSM 20539]AAF09715.1 phosphoribosylanthranilate isomerase [Deinococcus radiodurans R1 = ATCC 13939 = DSM 20539]ANC72590.1 N-(5'-phosphoribosyl)anthranilate isomerase [Deinococcus radiodurans R1 = ATCC 13939 = DSM 20539]QEM72095.1 phosphoribosylanthranilate isomerase [Deinococcus radiodurans]QIP28367.1 p
MSEGKVRVKVCGTTTLPDALHAAAAGADALGFIFAPGSKRRVTASQARGISLNVGPSVARIGVFMGQSLDEVLRTAEAARVSAVQLHGPLPGVYVAAVAGYYPVLRVLGPEELQAGNVQAATVQATPGVTLMLDAPQPGSGQPLDWAALVPHFPPGSWLAGGLGPDNVAQAIATLRPAGVDAVSRLEASPGLKNPQAVEAFIDAVKRS